MNILDEIFKDNKELLETKEVKDLIEYVRKQHKNSFELIERLKNTESEILELCMYSKAMLIDGKECKQTIYDIMEKL